MFVLCIRLFAFLVDLFRSPCFPPYAHYTRTADQNVTMPTSTQHNTGQLALHKQLLALSSACSHQIIGLFFVLPIHTCFSCILPRAIVAVAGGVRRPRSGALVSGTFIFCRAQLLTLLGMLLVFIMVFCAVTARPPRPFIMQSDLSVENGLFRLKPKSGFLTQSKKDFFDSTFSTGNSDWRIQSKNSVEKVLHVFF